MLLWEIEKEEIISVRKGDVILKKHQILDISSIRTMDNVEYKPAERYYWFFIERFVPITRQQILFHGIANYEYGVDESIIRIQYKFFLLAKIIEDPKLRQYVLEKLLLGRHS